MSNKIPKQIQTLLDREAEMEAVVNRFSIDAFRAERDRLEILLHSGTATDQEIEAHANSRDGGPIDLQYRTLSASSATAVSAFRIANWPSFREFLQTRLKARRDREEAIGRDVESLRSTHGIMIDYSDPQASITSQLALIVAGDGPSSISFRSATETFTG